MDGVQHPNNGIGVDAANPSPHSSPTKMDPPTKMKTVDDDAGNESDSSTGSWEKIEKEEIDDRGYGADEEDDEDYDDEDEDDEESLSFNDVFSLRRPRDVAAGTSSGFKSIVKGVFGGIGALIATPIVGAVTEGPKGFAKGLVAGAVGAVVLPLTGTVVGVTQIGRGLYNTPEAVVNAVRKGKFWDPISRRWVNWNPMKAIIVDIPRGLTKRGKTATEGEDGDVHENADTYYKRLQVPTNAGADDIRRQYFKLARSCHPDKNPDNEEAHEQFQQLSEAYQVLSDPELRARYDATGEEGLSANDSVESGLIFTCLFGSDAFAHLIGELRVVTAQREECESLSDITLQRAQMHRVESLGVSLAERLAECEKNGMDVFVESATKQANDLVTKSFGDTMLIVIGQTYQSCAEQCLGGLTGLRARFGFTARKLKNKAVAVKRMADMMMTQHRITQELEEEERRQIEAKAIRKVERALAKRAQAAADDPVNTSIDPLTMEDILNESDSDDDEDENPYEKQARINSIEEKALPAMLDAIWSANVTDIEDTLGKVCKNAVNGRVAGNDSNLPASERKERARALFKLGEVFKNVGQKFKTEKEADLKDKLKEEARLEKEHQKQAKATKPAQTGNPEEETKEEAADTAQQPAPVSTQSSSLNQVRVQEAKAQMESAMQEAYMRQHMDFEEDSSLV